MRQSTVKTNRYDPMSAPKAVAVSPMVGSPSFRGAQHIQAQYDAALRKIVDFGQNSPIVTTIGTKNEYFAPGRALDFAAIFKDNFFDKSNTRFQRALNNFIHIRKDLLGDRLKGAGTPCILFTSFTLNGKEFVTAAISGIQSYTVAEMTRYDSVNKEDGAIKQNIAQFWNEMNAFFEALSQKTNTNYIFLGSHSQNYDALINAVARELDLPQASECDIRKSCAEKPTWNFFQKLLVEHGSRVTITGSQAFSLSMTEGMSSVPPCKAACMQNIRAIKTMMEAAKKSSPVQDTVSDFPSPPIQTTPAKEPNAEKFGLFHSQRRVFGSLNANQPQEKKSNPSSRCLQF